MAAYLGLGFLWLSWLYFRKGTRVHSLYWVLFALVIFLLTYLKGTDYGSDDLKNYDNLFYSLKSISYATIVSYIVNAPLDDYTFQLISKPFADIGMSSELWMGIIGLGYANSLIYFLKKNSRNVFISILMVFSLEYLGFSFTALRQTVAISILLFAYQPIKERKLIKFVLFVLIASLFHSTAILFFLAYPLSRFKASPRIYLFLLALGVSISLFYPMVFRSAINLFAWNEKILGYASVTRTLNWIGFIIQLFIFLFCLYSNKFFNVRNRADIMMLNLVFIGLLSRALSSVVAEAFRISLYYSIFSVAMLPNVVENIKDTRAKVQMRFAVSIVFFVYMLLSARFFDYHITMGLL